MTPNEYAFVCASHLETAHAQQNPRAWVYKSYLSEDSAAHIRRLVSENEKLRADTIEECALIAEEGFRFALDGDQIADKIRGLK